MIYSDGFVELDQQVRTSTVDCTFASSRLTFGHITHLSSSSHAPIRLRPDMELNPKVIDCVIHPTAAYITDDIVAHAIQHPAECDAHDSAEWGNSQLNPKNRIDSLAPLERPLWRIDGCTSFGSQFYAIPSFMDPVRPLRIDVFIPELSTQSRLVRDLLELDRAFHTRDRRRAAELAISRHILRRLQKWTLRLENPQQFLTSLPFGSRLTFENLSLDVERIAISIGHTHALENSLWTVSQLQTAWGPEIAANIPSCVDISEFDLLEQLHDSTCLARIGDELFVLKALTSYPKYLYHELRELLRMRPHPNIVARPVHLMTKQVKFGTKRVVLGFTLEFHAHGTLRDIVPSLAASNSLYLTEQFKWALQIASALVHHRETSRTFYTDLRLDNIVLSRERDAVMVDFEQRGVWCEFAAPEINAIEYMRILALDEQIPEDARRHYAAIAECLCPGYQDLHERESYTSPADGYNVSWLALSPREQEAAEAYMLARVLWCIFEGVGAPQRATIWVSYRRESHLQFPQYERTPYPLRDLIDRSTRGRRSTLEAKVIRQGSKLVLQEDPAGSTSQSVREAAKAWWQKEVLWAEEFITTREAMKNRGEWNDNPYGRPSLREILTSLHAIREGMGLQAIGGQ